MVELEAVMNLLLENGLIGGVLAWFMFRYEKLLKNNNELLAIVKDRLKK